MKRLKFIFPILFLVFSGVSYGQTAADANAYFETGDYHLALEAYKSLLKKKPKDALYNYRVAYSAYMLGEKQTATDYFKKSASKYPESNYYLGEIFFDSYHFEEAVAAYSDYLAKPIPNDTSLLKIELKQKQAELGARFLNRVEDVAIVDSIVVDKSDFLKKIILPLELGSISQRELLTEKGPVDNIRYTTQRGDRAYFSELINGQTDLFTAYKLLDDWAEKTPLSDLNTVANENYPFLMLDGVTLYFASDGGESMGGYDILITRLNTSDNTFLKPENVGMPFNSPFNDYMMIVDEMHKVGWFASDRYLPEGKVAIYQFIPNIEKKIIRTENMDSLVRKAQIKDFSASADNRFDFDQQTQQLQNAKAKKIYINDQISYADASEFRSNTARNNFFQLEKLSEELDISQKELEKLRKTWDETKNEFRQSEIGKQILQIEERVREIKPQIVKLGMDMRNEEIKSLQ